MMGISGKKALLSGIAVLVSLLSGHASENNFWPLFVEQAGSPVGRIDQVNSFGPFFSLKENAERQILSFRPLWTSFHARDSVDWSGHLVYPFANWESSANRDRGNVLQLLRYFHDDPTRHTRFELFPFLFANRSPSDGNSYFALFPLGGTLKNRLWRDRIDFAAWPLFVRTKRNDEVRYHFPYPFLRRLTGPHSSGFGVWPFYLHEERENDYDHTWIIWPFHYNHQDDLDKPVAYRRFGILPFYARETGDGLRSETFAWPFFGYTREDDPRPVYSENRYFWPLLVQGRGEEKYINRWMPLYTHETRPGYEKHWYLWPLFKEETFTQPGLSRVRGTVLYFLYRDEQQFFSGTTARKTTLWPLYSYWNNGTGQSQIQALDPLTVFFPNNEKVRENWNPLFALYRFDERSGNRRHSLFWNLLVWEKDAEGFQSFYAGPLFEWVADDHWNLLKGLVGTSREKGEKRMHFFWKR